MQRGWEVRAGLGCMLGNKGGWADFRPGPAEGLRGSPMSLLPIWDGESMLRGHQRTAQGSLCGFAVATRPVSIEFGSWAWTWARGPGVRW